MSHYECTNCGEPLGQGYGFCTRCTPEEYMLYRNNLCNYVGLTSYYSVKPDINSINENLYNLKHYDEYVQALNAYNGKKPEKEEYKKVMSKDEIRFSILRNLLNFMHTIEKEIEE